MRITKIELENFRAFYSNYVIDLGNEGKNLLVYGENGSGKSSLYKALKYFIDSHRLGLNFLDFKNIFNQKDEGFIKFSMRADKKSSETTVVWSHDVKETHDRVILESAKTKAFIDYKKLLETYFLHIDENEVNIYDLLIDKLFAHIENEVTGNTFIDDYNTLIDSEHGKHNEILKSFNDGLSILLGNIAKKANVILQSFDYKINVSFEFDGIKKYKVKERDERIKNKKIVLKVDFFNHRELQHHHLILNEAKLSAIAIAIFFASILEQPESDLKILALDDVLIGLDMSNRMPIIDILEKYFSEYQIFFMTYDKTWFDIIKQKVDMNKWKAIEFFSNINNDFEIPVYADNQNFIERAENYLSQGDLKSSVVYLRSAFENALKKFCDKHHLPVKYKIIQRHLTTEDFLQPVMQKIGDDVLKKEIELHRTVILNPLSHSTIASVESKEVKKSIEVIKTFIEKLDKVNIAQSEIQQNTKLDKVIAKVNKEIDFEKDVFLKLVGITTTQEINEFLKSVIYEHIQKFDLNELERFFDEMQLAQKINLFDLDTEASFVRIFTKNEWNRQQQKIWCSFVKYLDDQGKVNEPFLFQKLEAKNCLKKQWHNYEDYSIDCNFIDEPPASGSLPEIDLNEDEIPF